MKKGKEWLKAQVKDEERELKSVYDNYVPYEKVLIADDVNDLINQLDEPELPVIPQFVASAIEKTKENRKDITILNIFNEVTTSGFYTERVDDWVLNNPDVFTRAWLDGYTIEKVKMYHVLDQNRKVMIRKYRGVVERVNATMSPSDYPHWQKEKLELTEQEIKDYDERYWAFAEEVPNE